MLNNQIDTFLFELKGKHFCSNYQLVSVAHYTSNKVSEMIRLLQ